MNLPEPGQLTSLADEIRVEVAAAEADWQSAVKHAITAGEKLTEAKALVNHGEWLPWLEANFDGSERTARNYMRLASNRQRVADLPTVRDALATLAPPPKLHSKWTWPLSPTREHRVLLAPTEDFPYRVMPAMTDTEYQGLKESIQRFGLLCPIVKDQNGFIIDGHHRARAIEELRAGGIKLDHRTDYVKTCDAEDWVNISLALNLLREHYTEDEKASLDLKIAGCLVEKPKRED